MQKQKQSRTVQGTCFACRHQRARFQKIHASRCISRCIFQSFFLVCSIHTKTMDFAAHQHLKLSARVDRLLELQTDRFECRIKDNLAFHFLLGDDWLNGIVEDVGLLTKPATLIHASARHEGAVIAVSFSPDNKLLASASSDASVRLWHIPSGELKAQFIGHTKNVMSVGFSPDGKRIVSGGADNTVRMWSVDSTEQLELLEGHTNWVWSVQWSPSENLIASGSWDKNVILWNTNLGMIHKTLIGHSDWVWSVSFSKDGSRLISGSKAHAIIWHVKSGTMLLKLAHDEQWALTVRFSYDDEYVVTACPDAKIRMIHVGTGREIKQFKGHTCVVMSATLSKYGSLIASASYDKSIRLWDVASTKQLQQLDGHTDRIWDVAFSRDGKYIASASEDRTVRLWHAPSYLETEAPRPASHNTPRNVQVEQEKEREQLPSLAVMLNLCFANKRSYNDDGSDENDQQPQTKHKKKE